MQFCKKVFEDQGKCGSYKNNISVKNCKTYNRSLKDQQLYFCGTIKTTNWILKQSTNVFFKLFHNWKIVLFSWVPLYYSNKVLLECFRNGILLSKIFWPTVRKNCSSVREKLLKFEAGKIFEIKFRFSEKATKI